MSNQVSEIARIRQSLQAHLASEFPDGMPTLTQSYLVNSENEFSGIRFRLGDFVANWRFGETTLEVYRGRKHVTSLSVAAATTESESSDRRAA